MCIIFISHSEMRNICTVFFKLEKKNSRLRLVCTNSILFLLYNVEPLIVKYTVYLLPI